MTPLRLVIIASLIYIIYRLLIGPRKKKVKSRQQGTAAAGGAAKDVLVEDPVCNTYIPKRQAVQLHHEEKMYYFCSNKCCKMFLKNKGAEE